MENISKNDIVLSLRIIVALYFDEASFYLNDKEDIEAVNFVRNYLLSKILLMEGDITDVMASASSSDDVAPPSHPLNEITEKINLYIDRCKSEEARDIIRNAALTISSIYEPDPNLRPTSDRVPSQGNHLHDMFKFVIETINGMLIKEFGSIINKSDFITLDVQLFDSKGRPTAFCVTGNAFISEKRRSIRLEICDNTLIYQDFWHIVYAIYHELICHGCQAVLVPNPPDAHPRCHWSEGWMDSAAYDAVLTWSKGGPQWLPPMGGVATGAVRKYHDARYETPQPFRFEPSQMMLRRRSRDGYAQLGFILFQSHMAQSMEEAKQFVMKFSLLANASADCTRLRFLGERIAMTLVNPYRQEAGLLIARACLAFTVKPDFNELETAVNYAVAS